MNKLAWYYFGLLPEGKIVKIGQFSSAAAGNSLDRGFDYNFSDYLNEMDGYLGIAWDRTTYTYTKSLKKYNIDYPEQL